MPLKLFRKTPQEAKLGPVTVLERRLQAARTELERLDAEHRSASFDAEAYDTDDARRALAEVTKRLDGEKARVRSLEIALEEGRRRQAQLTAAERKAQWERTREAYTKTLDARGAAAERFSNAMAAAIDAYVALVDASKKAGASRPQSVRTNEGGCLFGPDEINMAAEIEVARLWPKTGLYDDRPTFVTYARGQQYNAAALKPLVDAISEANGCAVSRIKPMAEAVS